MSRYYTGDHPCPGCNQKKPRQGKFEICFDCRQTLELGWKMQKLHDEPDADSYCSVHLEAYSLNGVYRLEEIGPVQ